MKTSVQYFILFALLVMVASAANRPLVFLLNGQSFPGDIAPPYIELPTVSQDQRDLLRYPNTDDLFKYIANGYTATCHIINGSILRCSNGLEVDIHTQTIQQVFQLLAENHILLHTPQQPPTTTLLKETKTIVIENIQLDHFDFKDDDR